MGNRLWRAKTPKWRSVVCEGEMAPCRSEEVEPWDGSDQLLFQEAVSSL
jgi:hypothetical protein